MLKSMGRGEAMLSFFKSGGAVPPLFEKWGGGDQYLWIIGSLWPTDDIIGKGNSPSFHISVFLLTLTLRSFSHPPEKIRIRWCQTSVNYH